MSKIVKRLLAPAYWISGSAEGHEGENNAPREAADDITRLKAELERWKEASTPSEGTKLAYWGEFHFEEDATDEEENLVTRKIDVPWHVVKKIMAAISARASLTQEKTDV